MTVTQLNEKYKNVPNELKAMKRWVCFKIEGIENGKKTKRPYNAMSGNFARVNDELTWSTFNIALTGCLKFNCDGLGFVLGDGIFGVDLDRHDDKMSQNEFDSLAQEFINTLDSYTEYSQSGQGIHIICKGCLPEGARRKGCVEMYDSNRFFAFTGNAIRNIPINDRQNEIKPLWEKYVKTIVIEREERHISTNLPILHLSDEEIIQTAINSSNGGVFYDYYKNGNININGGDHSAADLAFCNMLAFWTNGDKMQMDRIFRNSALMRDKWDEYRGEKTYGNKTIDMALSQVTNGYVKFDVEKENFTIKNKVIGPTVITAENEIVPIENLMNLDKNGEPIFRIKKNFKHYSYNDTGNALRFYDYFGDLFKYNVTDKIFMFWTGKTWIKDSTNIIRKYANKLIEILKDEECKLQEQIAEERSLGRADEAKQLENVLSVCQKNTSRIANKAGKDAMLSEFQSLYDVGVESSVFNQDDFLLNTESGIVDLETGEIQPYDRKKLISKNTNTAVSYEEPETWIKFLMSVFNKGNIAETQELIDSLQTCLGYSLSGSTKEQVMFLLYGSGSNGKSTLTETIAKILGDYGENVASSVLMQQKNANSSATYSIAKLQTARFVETGETDDGGKLAEAQVKILTGGDSIAAQFKYGHEFSFKPKFKIWMSTNNKPIIRGTDLGIWRRLFLFPFENTFTGAQKDKDLPLKLEAEKDKILGWCIKGFLKYQELGDLVRPKSVEKAIEEYKEEMDVITQFLKKECVVSEKSKVDCKLLYSAYKEWANNNSAYILPENRFCNELKRKGFSVARNEKGISHYCGLRLIGFNIGG